MSIINNNMVLYFPFHFNNIGPMAHIAIEVNINAATNSLKTCEGIHLLRLFQYTFFNYFNSLFF